MSLRWKSGLWLAALLGLVLFFAVFVGRLGFDAFRDRYGAAFARNQAQLQAQRLVTVINRELSLAQRLADLESIRRFLAGGRDRAAAFADLDRFRQAFADHSAFLIDNGSGNYYFDDGSASAGPLRASYTLVRDDPKDAWYFATIADPRPYAVNVNVDDKLKLTKVWFNVPVRDGGRVLGMAGTGLDLTRFLAQFVATVDTGVTNFIIDRGGVIQAHPDRKLIEYASLTKANPERTVFRMVDRKDEREALRRVLDAEHGANATGATLTLHLAGVPRTLGVAYIPELDWFAIAAVDLDAASVLDETMAWRIALVAVVLLLLFAAAVTLGVDRLVLRPLVGLTGSARRIAAGDYRQELRSSRHDELGELTRVFDGMAQRIRTHTEELEQRVAERTRDLAEARDRIAAAHHQIQDSIRYASRIQAAMLPVRELEEVLGADHFVLWQPRDVVGGDCYVFRAGDGEFIAGLIDCAGHGVPGAIMTMIAHAAFDLALHEHGMADPAALLARMDAAARALLPAAPGLQRLATNMDVGLCHVDLASGRIRFAGAHMALYRCDGTRCEEIPGGRRSLGERRAAHYYNIALDAVPGATYYLSTDGFLDQAGGDKGYGFGTRRFTALLAEASALPMEEQARMLRRRLAEHQGERPQRDDIAVLGFRIPRRTTTSGTDR